jgi:hypothetical protein
LKNFRGIQAPALGILLLLPALQACGQTSYFDVAVSIRQVPGVSVSSLRDIDLCVATVSGAASDTFSLGTGTRVICQQGMVQSFDLGIFQYGTDSDSGTVTFDVKIYKQDHSTILGEGMGAAAIKTGGRQTVAVEIVPDPTKFTPLQ